MPFTDLKACSRSFGKISPIHQNRTNHRIRRGRAAAAPGEAESLVYEVDVGHRPAIVAADVSRRKLITGEVSRKKRAGNIFQWEITRTDVCLQAVPTTVSGKLIYVRANSSTFAGGMKDHAAMAQPPNRCWRCVRHDCCDQKRQFYIRTSCPYTTKHCHRQSHQRY